MPRLTEKGIEITTRISPEVFLTIEELRGKVSRNAFCGMALEELFGCSATPESH